MTRGASNVGIPMVLRYAGGGIGPGGGPVISDLIGRILAVDDTVVAIERSDGLVVSVASLLSVVTSKVVPSVPIRSCNADQIGADNLMRICRRGWPAVATEPLGEWELRPVSPAEPTRSRYTAIPVAPTTRHSLRSWISTTAGDFPLAPRSSSARMVNEFPPTQAGRSWRACPMGQSCRCHRWLMRLPKPAPLMRQKSWWSPRPATHGCAAITASRTPKLPRGAGMSTYRRLRLGRRVRHRPHCRRRRGAGISGVEAAPEARRRGLATHIIDASRRWAAVRGADKIYLQTIRECTAAPRSMRRRDSATITNGAT